MTRPTMSRSPSARPSPSIGRFVANFPSDRVERRHGQFVGRCLIDTLAAAIAGANEPVSRLVLAEARDGWTRSPGKGAASAWVTADAFDEETAAGVNAATAHALDLDDVTSAVRGHVSSILFPVLAALAESRCLPGAALVEAYVVGFEIACRLGNLVFQSHYNKGWHSTSTIGAIAGAGAGARLVGLDAVAIDHAIGLALARSAGTRANFGSMAKA
ncbi:MAG: MmgE/PrpD family protein, partial [Alphaproteobacteria bacterium]|nr:MmgE/PrpD family protein [Alphaproteobacteria bacterium]